MTLVITVVSRVGIWQATDHKLSSSSATDLEPSIKHIRLECDDGKVLIAYAGLGSGGSKRADETHVSDWVRRVLRGRRLTIEESIVFLTNACNQTLANDCYRRGIPHTFSIAGFQAGDPRFYAITNHTLSEPNCVSRQFSIAANIRIGPPRGMIINFEGSGERAVPEKDMRRIRRTVSNRWKKPKLAQEVMALLADINKKCSNQPRARETVSSSCLVSCLLPDGTLTHNFFGWDSIVRKPIIPDIAGGHDVKEIWETIGDKVINHLFENMKRVKAGIEPQTELDVEELNELLKSRDFDPSTRFP